jgi:hypothetical protein
MAQSALTIARLKELLLYVPETGAWTWVKPQSNRVKTGSPAGVVAINGRRYIAVDGERHLAHRLSWFWVYGVWPVENVAPKNGDYLDLCIENLIEESFTETARKGGGKRTGVSGIPGVSWDSKRQQWIASVHRDYKPFRLGRFNTKEEAATAVQAAGGAELIVAKEDRLASAHAASTRRRQRLLWEKTLYNAGGITGWANLDSFITDVGTVSKATQIVVPADPDKMIGPDNFMWASRAEFDHTTREGRAAYGRAHREAYPDLYRDKELQKKFGIGLAEYREKENAQNGVCAICGKGEVAERWDDVLALAVDHDHDTGALRGLLCIACNTAIGKFHDDPRIIRNAVAYLEGWGKHEPVWSTPVMTEITHLPIGQKILMENRANG